jgi:hypothetical protein
MKKLILFCTLISSLCFAGEFDRFHHIHPSGLDVVDAWAECSVEMLSELIPTEAPNSTIILTTDEEGNVLTSRKKTLAEYVFSVQKSLDGTTAIIRLCAIDGETYRTVGVTDADLALWKYFLSSYGSTPDQWLNADEYQAKINSAEYLAVEP